MAECLETIEPAVSICTCGLDEGYLNILRNLENNYLDNLPLADHRNIFYQHDGEPPHKGYLINNFLEAMFYDQGFANNGPFKWSPRSPDLTVLDYFIWGTIKNIVYQNPLTTLDDCKRRK
ncbi:unnamed protein product [Acanthoscelides obtectus]|uniref:Transposase n=1 Tax=Acanthoscelides obtectus TaxID=200917 RepID=A0A9P0Q7K5_ACAOB|nr:unnamed protein product [Acanthoscelides obtectus]CAK1627012.1 hypothetical protein AOBTE_LOCUS4220 [Acanthoscelides obtectus]